MGYYINGTDENPAPAKGKVRFLKERFNAQVSDSTFKPDLVCVVDNGPFEAAAYCFSPTEARAFAFPDGRPKTWLVVPNAAELSGYPVGQIVEDRKGY